MEVGATECFADVLTASAFRDDESGVAELDRIR